MQKIGSDATFVIVVGLVVTFMIVSLGLVFFIANKVSLSPASIIQDEVPVEPEVKAGVADYATLFASMDNDAFPVETYHDLIIRFNSCMLGNPAVIEELISAEELSDEVPVALHQFMLSGTVLSIIMFGGAQVDSVHTILVTAVSECPAEAN